MNRSSDPSNKRLAFLWGFIDQSVSSAATLLLTIAAGRLLGPGGLGIIFVGFSSYLVLLGVSRAFIVDPLIAKSSVEQEADNRTADRSALTIVALGALCGSAVLLSVGAAAPTQFGRGLLSFAPWLGPLLVQDFLRCLLFRDGRVRLVTALDFLWLGTFVCLLPVAAYMNTDWAVAGAWGAGAAVAATVGLALVRARPERPVTALRWWRDNALSLGRWLAATSVVYMLCSYTAVILLALILGSAALGGLRAVLSAMTPLSLIVPALSLPGLPALARASGRSTREGRRLAARLGLAASVVAASYILLFGLAPGLLGFLFGNDFDQYSFLVWPLGLGQIIAATAIGFILLLKAERRGRAFFAVRSLASLASLVAPVGLGLRFGLGGSAWGFAIASAFGAALTILIAAPHHRLDSGVADHVPQLSST